MGWCEANGVDFLFGLAKNQRLVAEIAAELAAAEEDSKTSGQPARRFTELSWSTRDSRSRQRRVVAKAEWTAGEANPRFVVTSLSSEDAEPQRLYEEIYCARGDMENRIKECPLGRQIDGGSIIDDLGKLQSSMANYAEAIETAMAAHGQIPLEQRVVLAPAPWHVSGPYKLS